MPWLLNLIYGCLLLIASPVLLYRRWVLGKYRDGWSEKLWGRLPERDSPRPCVWLHAVSVGEVLQLRQVLRQLATQRPGWDFVITTTTRTGLDVARKEFGDRHTVCYFPLDFSWAVRRAIRRVRPSLIVLVELELWPNFITAAHALGVPLALINGRLSEKSFRGYRRLRVLFGPLLRKLSLLAAQNDEYAERLQDLGAPRETLHVTGSIKFDGVQSERLNAETQELREFFGIRPGERVFIAGSTQEPEESLALDTWQELRGEFPELRLVLVPRHKERFDEVAKLVASRSLPLSRRSDSAPAIGTAIGNPRLFSNWEGEGPAEPSSRKSPEENGSSGASPSREFLPETNLKTVSQPAVCLLDTLGELGACWGLADVAFVGGSLTQRGGQNMLEPAAYGAAVLFGPNTWNFRDIVEQLLTRHAARVVKSGAELTDAVREMLKCPDEAAALGTRARAFVASQQGATQRTTELLLGIAHSAPSIEHESDARRAA